MSKHRYSQSNKSKIIVNVVLVVLIIVFLVSLYNIVMYFMNSKQEDDRFNELADIVDEAIKDSEDDEDNTDDDTEVSGNSDVPEVSEDDKILEAYNTLHQENNDMVGWIKIDDTKVNYPVVHTPADEEYYLRRDFDGNYADSGVPFVGESCTVSPNSDNIVIYGHNMFDGTMFADTLNYKNQDYYEEHKIIRFDTLEERAEYEVYAAFSIDVSIGNGHFQFYNFIHSNSDEEFENFVDNVDRRNVLDTDVDPKFGDEFITLVTCDYSSVNGRLVIIATKSNEETE